MILVIELLTALVLDLKFSQKVVIGGEWSYERCSVPMVDISNYDFKYLTDKIVKPKESFVNFYVNKCLEYKITISSTQSMRRIIEL